LAVVCLSFFGFGRLPARAEAVATEIAIPRVAKAPALDGTLADPAWQQGAKVQLGYDGHTHSEAAEPTTAYLLTDGTSLFIGFDATQTRTPIVTTQRTNGVGQDADDEVVIALWPNGSAGFTYDFISTPLGTRYQGSSENSSYEPRWDAVGKVMTGRYTVTMRVPLAAMHGASRDRWMIQLGRYEPTTGSLYLWSGGPNVNGTTDMNYARPLRGMASIAAARPEARFGFYGLGAVAAPSAGGSTTRGGLDASIPITPTTSFVATIHPDFSNVENDQQSISPTAFRRYYSETRPFFTQGANAYNYMECDACPNEYSLYTPAIPTPRDGYAIEGKEGPLTFGGFDAVGDGRIDTAQAVTFKTPSRNTFVSAQRVSVDMPGFRDDAMQYAIKVDDLKHLFAYANYGSESGSNVSDPAQAHFGEIGGGYYGPNSFTGGGFRKVGAQYAPFDGFFSFSDIAGFGIFSNHTWTTHGGKFKTITASASADRYHGAQGLDVSDNALGLDMVTRKLIEFSTTSSSSYALISGVMTPLTQNQTSVTFASGTSTPTTFAYSTGRYGDGRLDGLTRQTTIALGHRVFLSLTANDNRQYFRDRPANIQWFERVSLAYQTGPESSFAFGVRRIVGDPPTPNGGGNCIGTCTNLSFAYHRLYGSQELYVAYGDPSQLATRAQFIVKLIRYVGAEKGT
jgi:hypothetical protein